MQIWTRACLQGCWKSPQIELGNDAFPMDVYNAEMDRCPEYTLLATLYASIDSDRLEYWGSHWIWNITGRSLCMKENRVLDFVYDTLEPSATRCPTRKRLCRMERMSCFRMSL